MAAKIESRVIQDLEERIKRGDAQSVRKFLKSLNVKAIDRRFALALANLCRRTHMITLGLRILNPILRSEKRAVEPATEAEKAEYAVLLLRVGAVEEAAAILGSLNARSCADASLYLAFCAFTRWEYRDAIPHLDRYISSGSITEYQRLVGQVNLAAAWVHEERHDEAKRLLERIQAESRRKKFLLLYGNSLELRAQLEISSRDFRAARKFIRLASGHLAQAHSLDEFFARKWDAVAACLESGDVTRLGPVREEARGLRHWETVRECDFYSALVSRDRELFLRVYFGTPFPSYREKLIRKCHWIRDLPETYILRSGPASREVPARIFDVRDPESFPSAGAGLPVGHLMHQALILLARDSYRPPRMGALFSGLYPGEYFHPHSSPGRIHQLIRRIRRWIDAGRIGLSIEESGGAYSIALETGLGLRVPREPLPLAAEELIFLKLRALFPSGSFTAAQARGALGISYTSGNRLLSWALRAGRLARAGSGPRTSYRLAGNIPGG